MRLVEERLLKERNRKQYCSSTKPGHMYKVFEKCGLRENVQSICCACGAADETVAHIVLECSKLE